MRPEKLAASAASAVTHMLYHVPPGSGVRSEGTAPDHPPGGRVIVGLNGADHLRELRGLIAEALVSLGRPPVRSREQIGLDRGEQLLRSQFASVTRHDFASQLRVPDAEPIAAYVRSRVLDAGPLAVAVLSRLPADPALFPITTHSGCLVCI